MGQPEAMATYLHVYITVLRWIMPVLAGFLLVRCIQPLLFFRREPEIWAWICMPGKKIPVTHWESVIGRHKKSDIVIDFPRSPGLTRCSPAMTTAVGASAMRILPAACM